MGSQAKAPAPLDRTSLCVNVGQALLDLTPEVRHTDEAGLTVR